MPQVLPLYIALLLVPYVAPADIACAQRVCKDWQAVFSSNTLLQAALRIHFPYSHEVRTRSSSTSSATSTTKTFNIVSRRYAALRSGTPQQELRVSISRTRRDIYVWTFAENLLVYQSSHYPTAVLSLIYLDYSASPRRIRTGTITLDDRAKQLTCVKVCRGVLVIERIDERTTTPGRSNFFATAECYRLQLSGQDEVSAKRMSVINTFEFAYIDYSHQILSDNSSKYYAAYSKSSSGFEGVTGVWEVETGKEVKRISQTALKGMGSMRNLLMVQNGKGQHQIVMVGDDKRNNHPRRWNKFPGEWGYLSNFRIFTVEHDNEQQLGGFVGRTKAECPQESNLLTTTFKVPRLSGGLEHNEGLERSGEEEEAGLVLWELDDVSSQATAYYYTISGDPSEFSGWESEEASQARAKYRIPPPAEERKAGQLPTPFNVRTRDALSFTMDFTGRNGGFKGTRLMLFYLRIQGFYPSPTSPGDMDIEWETCLKNTRSKKDGGKSNRDIYSANRNVNYSGAYGMEVIGDERAVVFLELEEDGMDLVIAVWDEPFDIPASANKFMHN